MNTLTSILFLAVTACFSFQEYLPLKIGNFWEYQFKEEHRVVGYDTMFHYTGRLRIEVTDTSAKTDGTLYSFQYTLIDDSVNPAPILTFSNKWIITDTFSARSSGDTLRFFGGYNMAPQAEIPLFLKIWPFTSNPVLHDSQRIIPSDYGMDWFDTIYAGIKDDSVTITRFGRDSLPNSRYILKNGLGLVYLWEDLPKMWFETYDWAEKREWTLINHNIGQSADKSVLFPPPLVCEDCYPLHIGDIWQYRKTDWRGPGYYFEKEILSDTVMPDGNRCFKGIENNKTIIERFDSVSGLIFSYDSSGPKEKENLSGYEGYVTGRNNINGIFLNDSVLIRDTVYPFGPSNYRKYVPGLGVVIDSMNMIFRYRTDLVWARVDGKEWGTRVGIEAAPVKSMPQLELACGPNPFSTSTAIRYAIPEGMEREASYAIYDISGKRVCSRSLAKAAAGAFSWNGRSADGTVLSSGIFYLDFTAGNFRKQMKLLMIK